MPSAPCEPEKQGEAKDLGPCSLDRPCMTSQVRIGPESLGFQQATSLAPDLHPHPPSMEVGINCVAVLFSTWGQWREQSLASQDPCKGAVELIYAPDISLPVRQSF